ncbi:MAG TPA: UbiA family prenyltransferase [Planctomycetota bacterium]|nr:UbiA family prenyltransferase [Planctomycetota bacterium]
MKTFLALLKLYRLPFVFTAVADSAAGYLVGLGSLSPNGWTLALLAAASAALYAFGMAANDLADLERDRAAAPRRVLPSGRLSPSAARAAALGALAVSALAAILAPGRGAAPRILVWAAAAGAVVLYDFFLRASWVMGSIRALNFLMGAAAAAADLKELAAPRETFHFAATSFVYVTALTAISRQEDRKEIRAPAIYLAVAAMGVAAAWAALLGPGISGAASPARWLVLLILVAGLSWRARGAVNRDGVMLLVRDGVGGIILLDAIYLLSAGFHDEGLAVAALVLPAALGVALFKKLP